MSSIPADSRKLLRKLLYRPVMFVADRFSSRPDHDRVMAALTDLYSTIAAGNSKQGPLLELDLTSSRYIIFSDQHKGARDGADDFAQAEPNYLAALQHYDDNNFHFISLGDNEELLENRLGPVREHNQATFNAEKKFIARNAFFKIFGNHDLLWDNSPFASLQLKEIYGEEITVFEGILLRLQLAGNHGFIFCTHGHQGDSASDGNWFRKFFLSTVWGPLQSFLTINPNTPSTNDALKTAHNEMMYEWSAGEQNLLLITGHTHQPVFESMTHLEHLYQKLSQAEKEKKTETIAALQAELKLHGFAQHTTPETKPTYFNSGCCCFDDGDITGIELSDGMIRLVKWDRKKSGNPERIVLEETGLGELFQRIRSAAG